MNVKRPCSPTKSLDSVRKKINFSGIFEDLINDERTTKKNELCEREMASVGLSTDQNSFHTAETEQKEHSHRDAECVKDTLLHSFSKAKKCTPIIFNSGMPLLPEELLLFTALNILFPSSPYKRYSDEKYQPIGSLSPKYLIFISAL